MRRIQVRDPYVGFRSSRYHPAFYPFISFSLPFVNIPDRNEARTVDFWGLFYRLVERTFIFNKFILSH